MGVHQLEDRAYEQANELMAVGEWANPYIHEDRGDPDVSYVKMVTWLRNGVEFVSIEEFEVKY